MADTPIISQRELRIQEIEDEAQYKRLMQTGEIQEGDLCFIGGEDEELVEMTNMEVEELLKNFT